MRAIDALGQLIRTCGIAKRTLSRRFGRADNYVSTILSTKPAMQADTLAQMASACDYALALIPAGELPANAIVIDGIEGATDSTKFIG